MGCIPPFLGAIAFTIIQFLVFLFVIVGTPLSQFDVYNSASCYTLFGYKSNCHNTEQTSTGKAAFGCATRRNNMNGGAAFAIISIFTTLAALVFGLLMLLRIPCAVLIPLILTCLSVVTLLISWGCVAGVYNISMCTGSALIDGSFGGWTNYGAGFGLIVTSWCLQVINVVVLVLISFF